VNVLCPGAVDTPMLTNAASNLKPIMAAEDMANFILFYGSKNLSQAMDSQ